jgi:hypothetical protein
MSFATQIQRSVKDFRVLVDIDSVDGSWSGRYSFHSFTPVGGTESYEGRLMSAPKVSIKRDSAFFGVLVFSASSLNLNNADGEFDSIVNTYNIIGATIRIWIGFADIDIGDYVNIYTGYAGNFTLSTTACNISISDLRRKIKGPNSTDVLYKNAVQGIEDILIANYGITAGSAYFDVSAMTAAKALTGTVYRTAEDGDTIDGAISDLSQSTMGFFFITPDGRYSFKKIDTTAASVTVIGSSDILNNINIAYDDNTIMASAAVSYPLYDMKDISTTPISSDSAWHRIVFLQKNSEKILATRSQATSSGSYLKGTVYMYKSTDYGKTYTTAASIVIATSSTAMYVTDAINVSTAMTILGVTGVSSGYTSNSIIKTTDGGSSWSVINNPYMTSLAYDGSGVFYCLKNPSITVSSQGTSICKSTDYCSSFSTTYTISKVYNANAMIAANGSGVSVLASSNDPGIPSGFTILRSSDSGSSWSTVQTVTGFVDADLMYIAGIAKTSYSTVYSYTINGSTTTKGRGSKYHVIYDNDTDDIEIYTNAMFNNYDNYYARRSMAVDSNDNVYWGGFGTGGILKSIQVNNVITDFTNIYPFSYYPDNAVAQFAISDTDGTIAAITRDYVVGFVEKTVTGKYDDGKTVSIDSSHTASVMSAYGIDKIQTFNTRLVQTSEAQSLGSTLTDYFKDIHGEFSITVPMKYYAVNVGDNVDVEICRGSVSMLGTKKCEVLGKSYDLGNASITFDLRII